MCRGSCCWGRSSPSSCRAARGPQTCTRSCLPKSGYGTLPIGFARAADGRLHVAFETNTSWGDSASGVGAVSITPSGHVGPQVQALSWGGAASGSPNGIPGLAVMPSGALQAVFGGSPNGVDGPWGITSTDGGATWSAPANVGSGSMAFGDSNLTLQVSNGAPGAHGWLLRQHRDPAAASGRARRRISSPIAVTVPRATPTRPSTPSRARSLRAGTRMLERRHLAPAGGADRGRGAEGADPVSIWHWRSAHSRWPRQRARRVCGLPG